MCQSANPMLRVHNWTLKLSSCFLFVSSSCFWDRFRGVVETQIIKWVIIFFFCDHLSDFLLSYKFVVISSSLRDPKRNWWVQLNNSYNKVMMSRCLDESVPIFKNNTKLNTFRLKYFWRNRIVLPLLAKHLCDVLLFRNWRLFLCVRFEDSEDIKRNTMVQLHTLSKVEFQRCFDHWKTLWNKCVEC